MTEFLMGRLRQLEGFPLQTAKYSITSCWEPPIQATKGHKAGFRLFKAELLHFSIMNFVKIDFIEIFCGVQFRVYAHHRRIPAKLRPYWYLFNKFKKHTNFKPTFTLYWVTNLIIANWRPSKKNGCCSWKMLQSRLLTVSFISHTNQALERHPTVASMPTQWQTDKWVHFIERLMFRKGFLWQWQVLKLFNQWFCFYSNVEFGLSELVTVHPRHTAYTSLFLKKITFIQYDKHSYSPKLVVFDIAGFQVRQDLNISAALLLHRRRQRSRG